MRLFGRFRNASCSEAKRSMSEHIDGRLDPDRKAALDQHLGICPQCRQELHSLEATVAVLRRLPEVAPSRSIAVPAATPQRARKAVVSFGMATAAVCLVLVLAFAADLANVFQTTTYLQQDDTSDDGIGRRSTSELNGSSNNDPDQYGGTAQLSTESHWVRPLEFGLIGATVVLGGVTYLVWRRGRRPVAVRTRR